MHTLHTAPGSFSIFPVLLMFLGLNISPCIKWAVNTVMAAQKRSLPAETQTSLTENPMKTTRQHRPHCVTDISEQKLTVWESFMADFPFLTLIFRDCMKMIWVARGGGDFVKEKKNKIVPWTLGLTKKKTATPMWQLCKIYSIRVLNWYNLLNVTSSVRH